MKSVVLVPENDIEFNKLLGVDTALPNETFLIDFFNGVCIEKYSFFFKLY